VIKLAVDVAPQNRLNVFERGEICYKIVYYTLNLDKAKSQLSEIALES